MTVINLLHRKAIQYRLGRDLTCLDPCNMMNTEKNLPHLKSVLCHLVQCNRVPEADIDEILVQSLCCCDYEDNEDVLGDLPLVK